MTQKTGNFKRFDLIPTRRQKSFYGKAKITEYPDGTIVLTSYKTEVAYIDGEGFHRTWGGYSVTTMNHINSFLDTFGITGGGKTWWESLKVEPMKSWVKMLLCAV